MSDPLVYRCEWKKNFRGVYVETHSARASIADHGKWVWYESQEKARSAEASRMQWLAGELLREADSLTRHARTGE